jgi:hypothetical protein
MAAANCSCSSECDERADWFSRRPCAVIGRHTLSFSACIRGALFNQENDCIWDFDLVGHEVEAHNYPWSRKGDVNAWLASEVFNLKEPVSVQVKRRCSRHAHSCGRLQPIKER